MLQSNTITAPLWRFGVCCAVVTLTAAASWIDPQPAGDSPLEIPRGSRAETAPKPPITITLRSQNEAPTRHSVPEFGVKVTQWRFGDHLADNSNEPTSGNLMPGRPLYLWIALEGAQAAIDAMRADHRLTIEVHWVRESGEAATGAPNLVTGLTIGRPGLAGTFEQQVCRKGFFEWHSWARKDTISPGTWAVSLTYPDGELLTCGDDAKPCQFTIKVG
jgi:hypothetical protein